MKAEKKRPEVALGKRLAVSNNFPQYNQLERNKQVFCPSFLSEVRV
jgi:hypothetical protein